jgi:hypothetical protein
MFNNQILSTYLETLLDRVEKNIGNLAHGEVL